MYSKGTHWPVARRGLQARFRQAGQKKDDWGHRRATLIQGYQSPTNQMHSPLSREKCPRRGINAQDEECNAPSHGYSRLEKKCEKNTRKGEGKAPFPSILYLLYFFSALNLNAPIIQPSYWLKDFSWIFKSKGMAACSDISFMRHDFMALWPWTMLVRSDRSLWNHSHKKKTQVGRCAQFIHLLTFWKRNKYRVFQRRAA